MTGARQQVTSAMVRGARALAATVDECRSRYSHFVVETTDRRSGFALFGGWKARHRFERLYLGACEALPVRPVLHRSATADDCRALARQYGLVVFCGDSAPSALADELLTLPLMVDTEIATPAVLQGPGAPWSHAVKQNLRKVRAGRFEFDIQRGDAGVPEFYTRMLLPTMKQRHGAEAYIATRRELSRLALAEGGELLRVLQDGTWVGASLNQATPDGYRLIKLAWAGGDAALLKAGVVSAAYWFSIQRAAALGQPRVLFGGSLPELEDGVLQHKAFWGGRLSAEGRHWGSFRLLLDPSHPDCRRFLQTHSLIARVAGGGYVVFSGGTPETVTVRSSLRASLSRWYTWREQPMAGSDVVGDEVPRRLRPWLSVQPLTPNP